MFVGRAMSGSGECVLGWGAGWVGGSGEKKKTYYLMAPFEIADFRGE